MKSNDLLDQRVICERLSSAVAGAVDSVEVLDVVDSTSEFLRRGAPPPPGRMKIALAEYQTGGRGRLGRRWLSPFGGGLCMSAGWSFPVAPPNLPALSLACGVAVHRALATLSPAGLGLKWPNDIVAGGAKLGGLLIDVQGESDGPIAAVVGIGINVEPVGDLAERFDNADSLPPTGLRSLVGDRDVSRNELAADVVNSLFAVLREFESSGFAPFADEWRRCDAMCGEPIRLRIGDRTRDGVALGIDDDGALLFGDTDGTRSVISGEVTLRRASADS